MSMTGGTGPGAKRFAVEGLYEVIAPAAYRTALSILRSPADAEDVSQDACLVVFRELEEGRTIEHPKEYAAKVALRLAMAEKARAFPITEIDEAMTIDDRADVAMRATSLAWKAMEALTRAQRAAVVLFVVE